MAGFNLRSRISVAARKALRYVREPGSIRYDSEVWRDYWALKHRLNTKTMRALPDADQSRQVLIVSLTELPVLLKFHGLLALALRIQGYHPVLLLPSKKSRSLRYLRLFGVEDILAWKELVQEDVASEEEVSGVVDPFLAANPGVQDLKRFQYRGVFVGKHALSSAIRTRLRGQFDLRAPEQMHLVRENLIKSVNSVLIAEKLLAARPVKKIIVRDAGYTPNGGIYEVGLLNGIDCIRCEMAQMRGHWLLKRYDLVSRGQALFSLSEQSWKRLRDQPLTSSQERELEENFKERYDPGSVVDLYKYQDGKLHARPQEVRSKLGLDPHKKTAVIFSHISWDASFFDGEDLYDDYEQWLVETVRVAKENPHLNWIVKLHPANQYKLKREADVINRETETDALESLGSLPEHVKILHADTDINTYSLFEVMDYGVTVRGTIGMELPCFGIPVLTAGTGRYEEYGFTIDSISRAQYEDRLRNLQHISRLSDEEVSLARRHAYWTLIRRQVSFEDIARATSMPHDQITHPLHYNVEVQARSLEEIRSAASLSAFVEWLLESNEPDFMTL